LNNELTNFILNDSLDVSEAFMEYCNNAVLMIKDSNTFYLYNREEYDKLIEKIKKIKKCTALLRYIIGTSIEIESFKELPEALHSYAEHYWGKRYTSFSLIFDNGIYKIFKNH